MAEFSGSHGTPLPVSLSLLGLSAAADDLAAATGGHVDPRITLAVPLRGAGTGRIRGLAIVPPRLGDTVALLDRILWLRRRTILRHCGERHAERSGNSGRNQDLTLLHRTSPCCRKFPCVSD